LQDRKDLYIRAPWWFMINRPKFMAVDKKRSNSDGDPE
jgi:spore germination protein KA